MATNPMHQFNVHRIGPEINISGTDLSFTNASLFMVISSLIICVFLFLGTKEKQFLPPLPTIQMPRARLFQEARNLEVNGNGKKKRFLIYKYQPMIYK